MDGQNGGVSALAIAAATAAASGAGHESRELAHVEQQAATAKAAELIKLTIPKLERELAGLSLVELRALLVAEEAEGEARKRSGALAVIGEAIDKHPDQIAAIAAAPPAINAEAAAPVNGGPVDLELPDDMPANLAGGPVGDASGLGADDRADVATVPAITASATDAEVFAYLADRGALIVMAGGGRQIEAFGAIEAAPLMFRKAAYGGKATFGDRIDLSGVALPAAIVVEEVWLIAEDGGEPFRRCELPAWVKVDPGMLVAFPQGSLVF